MHRVEVESSCVESIGYDAGAQILEVEFVQGTVYQYLAVPSAVHDAFLAAESKGTFLNATLRDAFAFRRLPEAAY